MFENHRRGRQARNFTTNVPKISNRLPNRYFPKIVTLGAPEVLKAFDIVWLVSSAFNLRRHWPEYVGRVNILNLQ